MREVRTIVTLLAFAAACGGGDSAPATTNPGGGGGGGGGGGDGSTTNAINIVDNSFEPSATKVPVGTTITWTWTGLQSHDVTWNTANLGNSTTKTSGTFTKQISVAGVYAYHCSVHGSAMAGQITVQ